MSERLDTKLRTLVDRRTERDNTKAVAKKAERAHRQLEAEVWEEILDEHGKVTTLTIDLGEGYGTVQFQRRQTIRGRVLNEDEFVEAIRREGREDELLKPGVRQQVLNEEVRDRLDRGETLPDGVDFSTTRFISISKKG